MSNKTLPQLLTLLLPITILLLFLLRAPIIALAYDIFPDCVIYSIFHLYCPSCGNTRSVTALLHGDILTSLRFNIVPILLLILSLLAYVELATYSFGKQVKLLPRSLAFYLILIFLLLLYFVLRNFSPYLTP